MLAGASAGDQGARAALERRHQADGAARPIFPSPTARRRARCSCWCAARSPHFRSRASSISRPSATRLDKEIAKADADIKRVDAKLGNEKFVANAPEEIVEEEKEKREAALARKAKILEALERLKKASYPMRDGQPSLTARGAAAYRAVHQTHEGGAIFRDPFAAKILDDETRAALDGIAADPSRRGMRLFIVVAQPLLRGGAGGKRRARCAASRRARRWPRYLLAAQSICPMCACSRSIFRQRRPGSASGCAKPGLPLPDSLTFAPVDFERESLADGLARAGFRRDQPAFFQWLGVVPYLTREAISSTLDYIAGVPGIGCRASTTPSHSRTSLPSAAPA